MSEEHVRQVFGPPWVRESLAFYRERCYEAEKVVLALRRKLIAADSSLPNEYDGDAWHELEKV